MPTKLSVLRRRAGLTQEALAAQTGLSKYAIGNIEARRTARPHPDTMTRIVGVLGCRIEEVYEFEMPATEVIPRSASRSRRKVAVA